MNTTMVMKQKSRYKFVSMLIGSFLILVILIMVTSWFYLPKYIEQRLSTALKKLSNEIYTVDFKNIEVEVNPIRIIIHDLQIIPDTTKSKSVFFSVEVQKCER